MKVGGAMTYTFFMELFAGELSNYQTKLKTILYWPDFVQNDIPFIL